MSGVKDAPTTDLLALLESDPGAGILAVADLREQRTKAALPGELRPSKPFSIGSGTTWYVDRGDDPKAVPAAACQRPEDAVHIAAEANPEHVLAAVRLWRMVAHEMEIQPERFESGDIPYIWVACVAACRAYLGGTPDPASS